MAGYRSSIKKSMVRFSVALGVCVVCVACGPVVGEVGAKRLGQERSASSGRVQHSSHSERTPLRGSIQTNHLHELQVVEDVLTKQGKLREFLSY